MTTFGDRLKALGTKLGKEDQDIAKDLGLSKAQMSHYTTGRRKVPSDLLQKIVDVYGINPQYLFKDDANMYLSNEERLLNMFKDEPSVDKQKEMPSNLIEVNQETVRIPVLGIIACGDPILVEANYEEYRTELADGLPSGRLVYLEAKGDSMAPTIPDGSHVLIREQNEVEYGEIAAVLVNGNTEATLKRVKKQGDIVMLMPDNPAHEPIIIDKNNPAKIIGKAVRFTQDL